MMRPFLEFAFLWLLIGALVGGCNLIGVLIGAI